MITQLLAAVGRRRRGILAVGLVLSAAYVLAHLWFPALGRRTFPAMVATTAVLLLMGVVAASWSRPRSFMVQPHVPAFSTPPQPMFAFMGLAFLVLGTGMAADVVRDRASESFLPDQLVELAYPCIAILWVALAWRDSGVQLRPDGLWQRGAMGSLVVPWEASPAVPALPPDPDAKTVRLSYGRPDLVRRRGLHLYRNQLRPHAIDPRFLCAAIRYYNAHPQHRPAIGTQAEYERVLPHLLSSLDWSPPNELRPTGRDGR
ncbi:hypothetical protein ACQP2Y_08940 [Actinoplanes sp. CA-051413]|uniref:hypothetical protein n=1 Tax=Actinoplanes sp. CA-051413 TaxID=3239899 RepID=UPI003D976289